MNPEPNDKLVSTATIPPLVPMRSRFVKLLKWALGLGIAALLGLIVLVLFRDSILRPVIERRIQRETGLTTTIGKYSSSLTSPNITIRDLKLYNTPEFGGEIFIHMPEIHVEVDPAALSENKLRFKLLRINLAQLAIVRNQAGETNVFSLRPESVGKKDGTDPEESSLFGDLDFDRIETLHLSLGKIRYLDLANPANNREALLNLEDQVFPNVKSEADLIAMAFIIHMRSGGVLGQLPFDVTRGVDRR